MKSRIVVVALALLMVLSLLAPFYSVYTNAEIDQDLAQAFPESMNGLDVMVSGSRILPVDQMPVLSALSFRGGLLAAAVLVTLLGAVCVLLRKRFVSTVGLLLSSAGFLLWLAYAFYAQQLAGSLLFSILLETTWFVWAGVVASAALVVMAVLGAKASPGVAWTELRWRRVSALLAVVALAMVLLPFTATSLPEGMMGGDIGNSRTGIGVLTGTEPLLSQIESVSGESAKADIEALLLLSGNGSTVNNLFRIPTTQALDFSLLWVGLILIAAGCILQLLAKKVDKWMATLVLVLGAIVLLIATISMLLIDSSAYQFAGRTAQLMVLGLAYYTVWPLMLALVAVGSAACAAMSIASSDLPYFMNPIPKRNQMQAAALGLILVTVLLLFAPLFQAGVYAPGKVNAQSPATSRSFNAVQLLLSRGDEALISPTNRRGNPEYTEEPAANGYTAQDVANRVNAGLLRPAVAVWIAIALLIAAFVLLFLRKTDKRVILVLDLLAAFSLLLAFVLSIGAIPKDLGTLGAQIPLFAAMAAAIFAAFFAWFVDYPELPKKYKLFLMILPFLGFVLVFSYLPLAGWRYAFYNYRLGLPMDQQEFVGFKWFRDMVGSPAQRSEIVRVLRNTFAMSGLGLATSWLPVVFAIMLTEIKTNWFKKFAQIFTTLPNFISWVLVYSFALAIFSLDTGVVNHLFVRLGIIDQPIAWLNSSTNIWLKMWLWNTWKGLGWSAIMYLAAIAGIDQELYEAARVDGAGRFRQIWHITVPGILPTFFVLLLLSISNVINNGMEQYLVFQNAMNKSTIEVLDLYVYNISIGVRSSTTISLATAIGILKSLVSIVLLFLANSFSKLVRGESIV